MMCRDLAPIIARMLVEGCLIPGQGPEATIAWARHLWPSAARAEILRGYDIAVEIYEDDYLFEAA